MATRKSVIKAVLGMFPVDMKIVEMFFGRGELNDSQQVTFDIYEGGAGIALKGNFEKQSNTVNKDGFSTITVNPIQINEKVTDGVANTNKRRIGQSDTGAVEGGLSEAETRAVEDDMEGFAKLKKRALRLIKLSVYDVLTTGKVTVSGADSVTDEIDFGLVNKIVNDASTAGQIEWNDTTSGDPIKQLESEALAMGEYAPNAFVLGTEARKAFLAHPKVRTVDNTTTGKRANFIQGTASERAGKSTAHMKYLGTTAGDDGLALEIYAELDTYVNAASATVPYLDKNFVVGGNTGSDINASMQYGAIPIAQGSGDNVAMVSLMQTEWIDGRIKQDPAGIQRQYKSSPLPTMNQQKGFISIQATIVA